MDAALPDVDDLLHILQKLQFRCVALGCGMSAAIMDRFVANLDRHPVEAQIEKVKERISTLQEQLDAHTARSGSKAPIALQEMKPHQRTSHETTEIVQAEFCMDRQHDADCVAVAYACEAPKIACGALPVSSLPQPAHCGDTVDRAAACGTLHCKAGVGAAVSAAVQTSSAEAIASSAACDIGKHSAPQTESNSEGASPSLLPPLPRYLLNNFSGVSGRRVVCFPFPHHPPTHPLPSGTRCIAPVFTAVVESWSLGP
jgi:hypothetical protein